jgi:hypothetical protein
MKYLAIRFAIALLTFVIGVFVTSQVNRSAYYIWPDVDPQPKIVVEHEHHQADEPCVRVFVSKP